MPGGQRAVAAELWGPLRSRLLGGCRLAAARSLETHRCPSCSCTAWSWAPPPHPRPAGPWELSPHCWFLQPHRYLVSKCLSHWLLFCEIFKCLLLEHGRSRASLPRVLLGPWLGLRVRPVSLSPCQSWPVRRQAHPSSPRHHCPPTGTIFLVTKLLSLSIALGRPLSGPLVHGCPAPQPPPGLWSPARRSTALLCGWLPLWSLSGHSVAAGTPTSQHTGPSLSSTSALSPAPLTVDGPVRVGLCCRCGGAPAPRVWFCVVLLCLTGVLVRAFF